MLSFATSYWNTFLNKYGYIIHHFNVHFSLWFFFFFANEITLDYGNDVRQEANWSGFLFELKMGHKAAETTQNINNAFGPELLPITVQWWFKMF